MSLAIPQPDTGHATPFLEPLSLPLSSSLSSSLSPSIPPSCPRNDVHHTTRHTPVGGIEIVFGGGCKYKRIAMTRTVSRLRLSLTKRDTAEPLVNNVVFNIVLYGIALYDLYTASRLINFEHIEYEPRIKRE